MLCLVVAGCGPPPGALPRPAWDDPDVCEGVDNFHECARLEEERALGEGRGVYRSADTLVIPLQDGGERRLVDSGTNAGTVRFAYAGYMDRIGYHLVTVSLYEGAAYRLVHPATGEVTEVADYPRVSPDGRRLLVASSADVSAYAPNLLQLWRVTADGLTLAWELEPEGWGATAARWTDATTVRFEKTEPCRDGELCRAPATLRLEDGEWQVSVEGS